MVKMLSPESAALLMDVSKDTVIRLLTSGKLKGNKIGHQWRTTESDIFAYYNRPKEESKEKKRTGTRRSVMSNRITFEPIKYVNGRPNYV